eukprot:TRINITY_DN1776_c0_g3_i1.p1 TRINITY_DN1776_c0_g3~~TRINITY_DN1776_c0_g3_i1.p1  ORF type:complete len:274 (+),score=19.16 TRINITY_DN1776_c0_g3_i1:87-908(+)
MAGQERRQDTHRLWGEVEVLSCYSSSDKNSSSRSNRRSDATPRRNKDNFVSGRRLPQGVISHMNENVQINSQIDSGQSGEQSSSRNSSRSCMSSSRSGVSRGRAASRPPEAHMLDVPQEQQPFYVPAASSSGPWVRDETSDMPDASVAAGSSAMIEKHRRGECNPCMYFSTKVGCRNGTSCSFCHETHEAPRKRPRPCKSTRLHCKEVATMLESVAPDADGMLAAARKMGIRTPYMRALVKGRQRQAEGKGKPAGPDGGAAASSFPASAPLSL